MPKPIKGTEIQLSLCALEADHEVVPLAPDVNPVPRITT